MPTGRRSTSRRIWLVRFAADYIHWNDTFDSGKVLGSGAQNFTTQEAPRQASLGDIILTYGGYWVGTATALLEVGEIESLSEPPSVLPERSSVSIRMLGKPLPHPVNQDDLRRAAPDLPEFAALGDFPSWYEVTQKQWARIRALILHLNPRLTEDQLPRSADPDEKRGEISDVRWPTSLQEYETSGISLRLRNSGNVTWTQGELLRLSAHSLGTPPILDTRVLPEAVPPGFETELQGFQLPIFAPNFKNVRLGVTGEHWSEPAVRTVPVSLEVSAAPEDPSTSAGSPAEPAVTETLPASTPAEKRPPSVWLIAGNPEYYDWDRAFADGSVTWDQVFSAQAQSNLRQTQPGDLVLAYRTSPDRHIAGLGLIDGEPFNDSERGWGVQLRMHGWLLPHPVTLSELKEHVPDLSFVRNPRVSVSPVTAAQWSVIAGLIQKLNRDYSFPPDWAPPLAEKPVTAGKLIIRDEAWEMLSRAKSIHSLGQFSKAEELGHQALAAFRALGDERGIRHALHRLGRVAMTSMELDRAREYFEEALRRYRDRNNRENLAYYLLQLGVIARMQDRFEEARGQLQESLQIKTELNDRGGQASCEYELGMTALAEGDRDEAWSALERARALFDSLGDREGLAATLEQLARVDLAAGRRARAEDQLKAGVEAAPQAETRQRLEEMRRSVASGGELPPREIKSEMRDAPEPQLFQLPPPPAALAHESPTIRVHISPASVTLHYGRDLYSSDNLLERNWRENLSLRLYNTRLYGEALFNAIIHGRPSEGHDPTRPTLAGYRRAVDNHGGKVRFELYVEPEARRRAGRRRAVAPEPLHSFWWEYLKDPARDAPLTVSESAPFVRLVGGREYPPAPAAPLKVLAALCSPTDLGDHATGAAAGLYPLDLEQERAIMESGLEPLREKGLVEYTVLGGKGDPPVTLPHLNEVLQDGYHVVHLVAHGRYLADQDEYVILLQGADGRHDPVAAVDLQRVLRRDPIRLVILAACQSAAADEGSALRTLGPQLAVLGVPAVIAMQDFMPVDAAQLFTQHFYHDLARSGQVDQAMAATRGAMYLWYNRLAAPDTSWAIPVLLMSTRHGRLFQVDEQRAGALGRLQPNIRGYDQLPGQHDPRPRAVAGTAKVQAEALGLETAAMQIRFQVEGSIRDGVVSTPPVPAPNVIRQDRKQIQDSMASEVHIDAAELKRFMEDDEQGRKRPDALLLDESVYRQIALSLNAGKHLIFIGAPGTGKTTLAHAVVQFARSRGFTPGMTAATATTEWSTFDTIGGYAPGLSGGLEFRPGIFLRSLADASWLVIDEINRAEIDKAFGELFTALSGQRVDLPYRVGDQPVRILGSKEWDTAGGLFDYVMHPNWRILAAMNAYDKSFLFAMSFAFMRRFAFIDVGFPDPATFGSLLDGWLERHVADTHRPACGTLLRELLSEKSALMRHRPLGPAIVEDLVRYLGGAQSDPHDLLPEAFLLHVVPQLDGLDRDGIHEVYAEMRHRFQGKAQERVLERIHLLYSHLGGDWPSPTPPSPVKRRPGK